jgi:CRISPR/Cas system CSM-associated protein Csm4 (group 5 of RAMP superfamily)
MFKILLVRFLKEKNNIIRKITGIDFINYKDLLDIEENWEEIDCKNFLINISSKSDQKCCPWCSRIDNENLECSSCNYGYIHGDCQFDDNSTYRLILDEIHSNRSKGSIIEIEEIQDLIDITLMRVKKLCGRS